MILRALRSVFSVIAGYAVFAVSAYLVFELFEQPPHEAAPFWFMVTATVIGMFFAFIGGYVAAYLAGRHPRAHGAAVAGVLALGAAVSLVATLGKGAIWSQVAALVFMAPSAYLGGWIRHRQLTPPTT
ncbi:MAG TPA: hypothetical protein VFH27_04140 [Longimicrobiaceae bacterium]|nr:hypothetical protein [Longimicrobiaceae bacterium]